MTNTVQLSNGMKLIFEQKASMRSVAFGLWVRVGSVYDGDHPGIAHFIEHMIFKGNSEWDAKQIASQVDLLGAQLNAFTEKESTCYYGRVIEEEFSSLLQMVSKIVMEPEFCREEVEKERQVILEEIKMDLDTPDERIHDLLDAAMFDPSPYGEGILGRVHSVSHMESETLINHHKRYYKPDQMVLSIVGGGDFEDYRALVETVFSPYKQEQEELKAPEMGNMTPKRFVHTSKETEQLHLAMGFQLQPILALEDRILLSIVNSYLGSSMSSRLFQEFREERGWVYAIYSYTQLFRHHAAFNIYAGFQAERMEEVLGLLEMIFQDLQTTGISDNSVHIFKRYLKGTLAISDESPTSRMNYLGRATLFGEPIYTSDEILAGVEATTTEGVNGFLKKLLKQPMSLVTLGPIQEDQLQSIQGHANHLIKA